MDNTTQILITILSITLILFLIVAIVAVFKIMALVNSFVRVIQKFESITDKAGNVGEFFVKNVTSLSMLRFIGSIAESVFKRNKGVDKDGKD